MSASALKQAVTGEEPEKKLSDLKPKEQVAHLLKVKKAEIDKMMPKHLNADQVHLNEV